MPKLPDRISLLDPHKKFLIGDVRQELKRTKAEDFIYIRLDYHDQLVGFLCFEPIGPIKGVALEKKLYNTSYIATFSLLIALLLSLALARYFTRPVKLLAAGTKKLTSGHFGTHVIINSNDEFADLASDFNQLAKKLEKHEIQRKQWLVDIAHELRTPITVLQSEIEAMIDGIRKPTGEYILSLHYDVLALAKLVNDLYQLSLADSNEIPLRRDAVKLYDIICIATGAAEALLQKKQLKVTLIVPQENDTDVLITGDERVLSQLFSNLLENSSRYTDAQGHIEVTLQLKQDVIEVLIADSAPAVPNEALPLLFDRLYRVDKSRSRESGGSGLGLTICKKIVEAHKGTIQAEHSPLGGVLMRMHFPIS